MYNKLILEVYCSNIKKIYKYDICVLYILYLQRYNFTYVYVDTHMCPHAHDHEITGLNSSSGNESFK